MCAEEFEERGVAEVFFEIGALAQVVGVDLGDGQAVAAEVARELEEGDVLFADGIDDADGACACAPTRGCEPQNGAAGAAKLALQRLNAVGRVVKVPLEELLKNVHREGRVPLSKRYMTAGGGAVLSMIPGRNRHGAGSIGALAGSSRGTVG